MQLRSLYPEPAEAVDVSRAYALPGDGMPHLRVNMVSSADGAAAVDGRVGALSGGADQHLLHELRALTDVLLVGAGTVRAEGYGPIELSDEQKRRRVASGQSPTPRLAILTSRLDVDFCSSAFTEAAQPPLLLTTELAEPDRCSAAGSVAEVVIAGERRIELRAAVQALSQRGLPRVLSEGGPHVLAQLFTDDLVDELCLAVAPVITCGDEVRTTAGPALPRLAAMRLASVLERDDFLFLRYTVSRTVERAQPRARP